MPSTDKQYAQIARAIEYLTLHQSTQPGLKEVAGFVGLSESHFQRLFSQWVGVSPKKFLQFLTKEHAKQSLRKSTLLTTALDIGLSGSGRLHDLMLSCEGVTPGEYKNWGAGLEINYGLHDSPFGKCLIAQTERGVCQFAFYDEAEHAQSMIQALYAEWPRAHIERSDDKTALLIAQIFPPIDAVQSASSSPVGLKLLLKGSKFQLQVWEALLRIPQGEVASYQQVAQSIRQPDATRAVASAIARNNLGYLIPCHRVIRSSGEFNHYRWGASRKKALLAWEAARS